MDFDSLSSTLSTTLSAIKASPNTLPIFLASLPIISTLGVIFSYLAVSKSLNDRVLKRQVQGRHILITGGSKGLGKALAIILAKAGAANVTLVARGSDSIPEKGGLSSLEVSASEISDLIKKENPESKTVIRTIALDLTKYELVVVAMEKLFKETGTRVDWVIANAGAGIKSSTIPLFQYGIQVLLIN
jgi:5,10-methylene-tetrahydrofolate dehydrogenase/methenyl tetrahydrofolate cyclohydrolase